MNVQPELGAMEGPHYVPRRKLYPQSVRGTYRSIKWALLVGTLAIYYGLPFVRWDRGPEAPDQAVLVDLASRRFYFFFIEIWPQEVYYFTGLLIIAAVALFLMNAIAGRLWCGYTCPQTVWTDLFYAVERFFEGDRRDRMRLDKQGWTLTKIAEKVGKHLTWLFIAWWTGGVWVLYFADAPTLVRDLATGDAPLVAYGWIAILTFTTYVLAGHMREQVCTYMCPWPRIQAALTDEDALNVTYRYDRGEPRGSLKSTEKLRAAGQLAGDCIDCNQCVAVCPTGIDIRNGIQLECIQCGLCIDACDAVMERIGRPTRLIAYDTDQNILRRLEGKPTSVRIIRPRTIVYAAIIVLVSLIMLYALATRDFAGINVLHDRNPIFVTQSDGSIRNGYTIRILNKRNVARDFRFAVDGLPDGSRLQVVGVDTPDGDQPILAVGADRTREFRILIFSPPQAKLPPSSPVTFRITALDDDETVTTDDYFRAPAAP